jgi:integrase
MLVSEARNLRVSSIVWSHGRWTVRVRVKGGRERTIPLPKDVKQAIDHYLKLDAGLSIVIIPPLFIFIHLQTSSVNS